MQNHTSQTLTTNVPANANFTHATASPYQLVTNDHSQKWERQLELVKSLCAPNATDDEFELFCYRARTYGLDPLSHEIHFVKYLESKTGKYKCAIFAGRDGFLKIAHNYTEFDGMETFLIDKEGNEVLTTSRDKIMGAVCRVYRTDKSRPFTVAVNVLDYNTGRQNWAIRLETMIKKVVESQALRKAFKITDIYESAEFDKDENILSKTRDNEFFENQKREESETQAIIAQTDVAPLSPQLSEPSEPRVTTINENQAKTEIKANKNTYNNATMVKKAPPTSNLPPKPITDKQKKYLTDIMAEKGLSEEALLSGTEYTNVSQILMSRFHEFLDYAKSYQPNIN